MKESKKPLVSVSNFTFLSESSSGKHSSIDNFFGGIWLIGLGVVFLMMTFGLMSWGVWGIAFLIVAKVWPIFLLLGGVSIIAGDSKPAKILVNIVWLSVFAVIFILAISLPNSELTFDNLQGVLPESFTRELIDKLY